MYCRISNYHRPLNARSTETRDNRSQGNPNLGSRDSRHLHLFNAECVTTWLSDLGLAVATHLNKPSLTLTYSHPYLS